MMNSEDRGGELLVVFLKYPEPGRVKTRLASGIGGEAAAAVYRDLVAITLEAVGKWVQGGGKSREAQCQEGCGCILTPPSPPPPSGPGWLQWWADGRIRRAGWRSRMEIWEYVCSGL